MVEMLGVGEILFLCHSIHFKDQNPHFSMEFSLIIPLRTNDKHSRQVFVSLFVHITFVCGKKAQQNMKKTTLPSSSSSWLIIVRFLLVHFFPKGVWPYIFCCCIACIWVLLLLAQYYCVARAFVNCISWKKGERKNCIRLCFDVGLCFRYAPVYRAFFWFSWMNTLLKKKAWILLFGVKTLTMWVTTAC